MNIYKQLTMNQSFLSAGKVYSLIILLITLTTTLAVIKYFRIETPVGGRTIKVQITGDNWTNLQRQYEGSRPPYWYVNKLQPGLKSYSGQNRVTAEVITTEIFPRKGADFDVYLEIKLFGYFDTEAQQYIYDGQAVLVGRQIHIQFSSLDLYADIIDNEVTDKTQEVRKKVFVELVNPELPTWVYNALTVGLRANNGVSTIAEILEKKAERTELYDIVNYAKSIQLKRDDEVVKARIKLVIEVIQNGDSLYYGGHQRVKIGNKLWIAFPGVDLSDSEIVAISEIQ